MEIYRLIISLNEEGLVSRTHKIDVKETEKTFKVLEGKSGYKSIVRKDSMNKIDSGLFTAERLNGFNYESFVYLEDLLRVEKELLDKVKESFKKHFENFKKMNNHLNKN